MCLTAEHWVTSKPENISRHVNVEEWREFNNNPFRLVFENLNDVDLSGEGPDNGDLCYRLFDMPVHYEWSRRTGISWQTHRDPKPETSYEHLTEVGAVTSSFILHHVARRIGRGD